MPIQSEISTKTGLKAAVYTAFRSGRQSYTIDVYALVLDETRGKFHNIASTSIVKQYHLGVARSGSRAYSALLAQAQKVCEGWATA